MTAPALKAPALTAAVNGCGGTACRLARRQGGAYATQLSGRAAKRELVVLGRDEVPVHVAVHVDADAAVNVHSGVRDPVAGLRCPELRRRDLGIARQPLG